jgi:hypothetical protein
MFSFESQKKGWHYEWRGNKYTSELPHCFQIYVAAPLADGVSLQCVGVFASPQFSMFCRRRHRTVSEAEKTLMAEPVPEEELVMAHALGPNGMLVVVPARKFVWVLQSLTALWIMPGRISPHF